MGWGGGGWGWGGVGGGSGRVLRDHMAYRETRGGESVIANRV